MTEETLSAETRIGTTLKVVQDWRVENKKSAIYLGQEWQKADNSYTVGQMHKGTDRHHGIL